MVLCSYCAALPYNLFHWYRNTQCTIKRHPSYPSLQKSGKDGCEFCQLMLESIKRGRIESEWNIPAIKGEIAIRSTKFDAQVIMLDYSDIGSLRAKYVPDDWCKSIIVDVSKVDDLLAEMNR